MKRFVCLLALVTFSAAVSAYGQSAADQVLEQNSSFHHSTPKPSPGASPGTTKAAPTGPMEVGLFKDAKGTSAATTFAPSDTTYLIAKNVTLKKGEKVGVIWHGGKNDKVINKSDTTAPDTGTYSPSFHLSPLPEGSPKGAYRADFTQNGKVVKSLKFEVK